MEWKEFILILLFGFAFFTFVFTAIAFYPISKLEKVDVNFVIEEETLTFLESTQEKNKTLGLYESYVMLRNESNIDSFCRFKDSKHKYGYVSLGSHLNHVMCATIDWSWSQPYSIKEYINYLENGE